jgi:hypothetical protein
MTNHEAKLSQLARAAEEARVHADKLAQEHKAALDLHEHMKGQFKAKAHLEGLRAHAEQLAHGVRADQEAAGQWGAKLGDLHARINLKLAEKKRLCDLRMKADMDLKNIDAHVSHLNATVKAQEANDPFGGGNFNYVLPCCAGAPGRPVKNPNIHASAPIHAEADRWRGLEARAWAEVEAQAKGLDDLRMKLARAKETEERLRPVTCQCGEHFPDDANFCRKCGRPRMQGWAWNGIYKPSDTSKVHANSRAYGPQPVASEFPSTKSDMFSQIDRNHDGRITRQEIADFQANAQAPSTGHFQYASGSVYPESRLNGTMEQQIATNPYIGGLPTVA